jgi:hypothetical protein
MAQINNGVAWRVMAKIAKSVNVAWRIKRVAQTRIAWQHQ